MGSTWTVDVDGVKHTIVVDCDAQSRASIRVDGRLAAKPLSAGEDERELQVGSVRYVVRRLENNIFDLDIPPEVFLSKAADRSAGRSPAPRRPGGKAPAKQETSNVKKWIGFAVLALVVVGLIRYGARGFQYMRVPWQPYAEPDGSFKAKFPATPEGEEQTRNINGDFWNFRSRYSSYKNHFYEVQYVDLKIVAVEANAESLMTKFLVGWATAIGGTVIAKEKTTLGRNPALKFEIAVPPGAGAGKERLTIHARMRGLVAVRGNRLFLAWTLTAAADPFSADLRQFIEAFEIPPPPPPKTFEALIEQQPVPERPVAVAAPPPEAPPPTATIDPARLARETATRRAAEPQIYLEPLFLMYHVGSCPAVTGQMQRVSIEELPRGYGPHICVPPGVQNWRRTN